MSFNNVTPIRNFIGDLANLLGPEAYKLACLSKGFKAAFEDTTKFQNNKTQAEVVSQAYQAYKNKLAEYNELNSKRNALELSNNVDEGKLAKLRGNWKGKFAHKLNLLECNELHTFGCIKKILLLLPKIFPSLKTLMNKQNGLEGNIKARIEQMPCARQIGRLHLQSNELKEAYLNARATLN